MSAMKAVFELTDDPGELVRLLADVAEGLRAARGAGEPPPVRCLEGCERRCWAVFGPNHFCTACGSLVLSAAVWHALLTGGLAYLVARSPWAERRAA